MAPPARVRCPFNRKREVEDGSGEASHRLTETGYDATTDSALSVFVDAIARQDPRVRHLWFDVTTVARNATDDDAKLIEEGARASSSHTRRSARTTPGTRSSAGQLRWKYAPFLGVRSTAPTALRRASSCNEGHTLLPLSAPGT